MSAIRWTLKLAAFVALLPLGGCYTYAVAPMETATAGTQARLRLDDDGFGRLANQAAMSGFPVQSLDANRKGVTGRIVSVGSNDVSVEMRGLGGSIFRAEVPTSAVREFAVRSFSTKNTILVLAGGVALASTLASGVLGGTTSTGSGGGEGENSIVSFSLVSLFFW